MTHNVPAPLVPVILPSLRAAPGMVVTRAEPIFDGGLVRVRFPNGYGASIIRHSGSYGGREGLFEVAVLNADGELDYTTPITSDVEGWLTPDDVAALLARIAALPTVTAAE
jgi:hypothetical protein